MKPRALIMIARPDVALATGSHEIAEGGPCLLSCREETGRLVKPELSI